MDQKNTMSMMFGISLQKANEGELGAQLYVAQCYLNGDGVAQDYVESAIWMEKAREFDSSILKSIDECFIFLSNFYHLFVVFCGIV